MPLKFRNAGHPARSAALLLLLCSCLSAAVPVLAATQPPAPVTVELLESKIKEAEASSGLDEANKARLIELYRKTQTEIEATRGFEAATRFFASSQESALRDAEALRKTLARPAPKASLVELGVSDRTPLPELQQLLAAQQSDKSALETRLGEIDAQVRQQINRPSEAHQRISEARQQLDDIASTLSAPPAPSETPAIAEARRWLLQTRQRSLKAELQSLDQELLSQPLRLELLQAQRDQVARSLALASDRVALLQELAGEHRVAEAEQAQAAAEAAQRGVAGKHPLLQQLAEENAALSGEMADNAAALDKVNRQAEAIRKSTKQYQSDYKSAQQKLDIAGLSEVLGRVMLERRRQLPDLRKLRKQVTKRAALTAAIGLQQIRHSEERRDLGEMDGVLDQRLAGLPPQTRAELRPGAARLLASRRDLLDKAIALEGSYLRGMADLDLAERQLIDLVSDYDTFLAEHLLWIRSVEPLDGKVLRALPAELGRVLTPDNWAAVLVALGAAEQKPLLMIAVLLILAMYWVSPRLARAVRNGAARVGDPGQDRFAHTLQALLLVLLRALPWPLLLGLLGWQLEGQGGDSGIVSGVGLALQLLAPVYLNLRLFALLCEPEGVLERHFRWSSRNVALLRRQIRVLIWLLLPAAFLVVVAGPRGLGSETLGLSRLAFVAVMLALANFLARILSLRTGVVRDVIAAHPRGMLSRLRYIWYPLLLGITLLLPALALSGYYYTAGVLTRSLVNSLWLILALVLVHDLVVRWLMLMRLRLLLQELRRKEAAAGPSGSKPAGVPPVAEPELDLAGVDAGTRKLLNTALQLSLFIGLWVIWSAVLPAFAVLRDVALWQHAAMVDGSLQQLPVTLADLALAVVIAIITAAAARNLPNVFEIMLLRQLEVEQGTRYAYATLLRYLLVGVGVVVVFSTLGGSWSEIQWLVAALGVGIGFGLQEIVANFVSGLVILFERPIRVGDIVSVGDTTGVVSRIRIRATTITNWDRQELLVPNKEFITNRLLNWSLSDPVNRITVQVGIAYGSDVVKALQLLREAAIEHSNVLAEPEPLITFDRFGDNALDLKLRCYLPNADHRLLTISELHELINRKFNEAGIVIAFPQRDVHLDSSTPLEVRVTRATGSSGDDAAAGGLDDRRAGD